MPGLTRMRPQGEVHVVHAPPGFRPEVKPADGRDDVLFTREDQRFFRIDRILGAGAFGTAAKVRVIKDDERFRAGECIVIKQVRMQSERDKIRMMEEFKIARRLGHHPNIAEMYAYMPNCRDGRNQKCERLMMKYCNAGTLLKIMEVHRKQQKFLPEDFLWHVFEGLGWALARMHNGLRKSDGVRSDKWTGYVHYDLKPDNILLDWTQDSKKFPTPKIADFGCSGRIGRTPKWKGHLLYLSPEVRQDDFINCIPECDIWALGLTMYELMEFRFAFPQIQARDGPTLNYNKFAGFKTRYSSRMKDLVWACLNMKRRERPGAEEIITACKRYRRDIENRAYRHEPWGHHKLLMDRPTR